jgi:hypothetical protein
MHVLGVGWGNRASRRTNVRLADPDWPTELSRFSTNFLDFINEIIGSLKIMLSSMVKENRGEDRGPGSLDLALPHCLWGLWEATMSQQAGTEKDKLNVWWSKFQAEQTYLIFFL